MPAVDAGSFPVCAFNDFLVSGHKTRNFGHSRLKIMQIITEFYILLVRSPKREHKLVNSYISIEMK